MLEGLFDKKITQALSKKEVWAHNEARQCLSQFGITKQDYPQLIRDLEGKGLVERNKKSLVLIAPKPQNA